MEENEMKRATFIIDDCLLRDLLAVSYEETERQGRKVTITEVLDAAIREYLDKKLRNGIQCVLLFNEDKKKRDYHSEWVRCDNLAYRYRLATSAILELAEHRGMEVLMGENSHWVMKRKDAKELEQVLGHKRKK